MRTVRVQRGIEAQPEAVFDLITDHAHYDRFRGIHASELLREGDPPPNGLGATRRVVSRPFRFEEEITAFERPTRMDYLITKINAPLEHQGASIRLLEDRGRTIVEWTSGFRVPTPVVGGLMERAWSLALARGFRRVLEDVERMLTGR
ncbi:MAG: SRPBCC family protein [Solirubrobacterales bacterium]